MRKNFSDKYKDDNPCVIEPEGKRENETEVGFSLIEAIIAMVILMIVLLGMFFTFVYAINYNSGNKSRSQALALMQREVENLRSAKFTPGTTDAALTGGTKPPKTITASNGSNFLVQIIVDDDPATPGVQTDNTKTIKEITVTVTLARITPGWQNAIPATVIFRRARAN